MALHSVLLYIANLLSTTIVTMKLNLCFCVFNAIIFALMVLYRSFQPWVLLLIFLSLSRTFCIQISWLLFLYLDYSVTQSLFYILINCSARYHPNYGSIVSKGIHAQEFRKFICSNAQVSDLYYL